MASDGMGNEPKQWGSLLIRLLPSLVRLPFQLMFLGRMGLYFCHPLARIQGKVSIGRFTEIGPFCFINSSKGITLGSYCQVNPNSSIVGIVHIGDRVLIAPGCVLASGGHRFGKGIQPRFSGSEVNGHMTIGDDVWLGANCTVLGEITIGHNSVVAAGVVVDRDIPPGSLVRRSPQGCIVEPLR
jgi:acetyltransferase-like isoleucine patch superfamily enzyme